MNEVEKLVHTLDVQMTEMRKNLDMLQSMVVEKKERSINLKSLEEYAHNKKFTGHILHQYSQEEVYRYCCMLASAVLLSNDENKKSRQYFFLFRLYHTFFDQEIHEELLRDSQMISMKEWERIAKNYDSDLIDHLLTDMLLMISLDGSPEQKQLEYFSETAAYLLPDVKRTKAYFGVVRAILSMDEEALLEMAKVIDINEFYPYLGKKSSHYIVADVAEIKNIKAKKIRIYRGEFSNYDGVWNLDQYKGKELLFDQCQFIKIEGIKAYEVKTKFEHCEFKECGISRKAVGQEYKKGGSVLAILSSTTTEYYQYAEGKQNVYFMELHNASIRNCSFEKCKVEGGGRASGLIKVKDSEILSSRFLECKIGIHANGPQGTLVISHHSDVEKCTFQECLIDGEDSDKYHECYWLCMIRAYGGKLRENVLEKCICNPQDTQGLSCDNHMVSCDSTCNIAKNKYNECTATSFVDKCLEKQEDSPSWYLSNGAIVDNEEIYDKAIEDSLC